MILRTEGTLGGRINRQGTETNPKTLGEGAGTAPPSLSSSLGDDSGGEWLSCPGPRLPLAPGPLPPPEMHTLHKSEPTAPTSWAARPRQPV